jgi:hypothetical protein
MDWYSLFCVCLWNTFVKSGGQCLKNSLSIPVFELCTFSQTKLCINSAEKCVGHFFTKTSGHHVCAPCYDQYHWRLFIKNKRQIQRNDFWVVWSKMGNNITISVKNIYKIITSFPNYNIVARFAALAMPCRKSWARPFSTRSEKNRPSSWTNWSGKWIVCGMIRNKRLDATDRHLFSSTC